MFHVDHGLFFERITEGPSYGGVRITKREHADPESAILFDQVVSAEVWASIVSSMTVIGETSQTFGVIMALQK